MTDIATCIYISSFWLLDSQMSGSFFDFMSPENLMIGVKFMAVCIILIVIAIYTRLFLKKRHYFYTNSINKHLEVWITHIILEETTEGIQLPPKFYRILQNKMARQLAIDELIKCKKNFSGTVADTLVELYMQLGLKADSLKKIKSRQWHIKARGIQELYLMDQIDVLKTIYKNTNNKYEFVRMEAQTGVIHLTGFSGLRFLDVISYPLTEWQQLKLLEQLRLTSKKEDLADGIAGWLLSKNDTVVIFALKLADEYQQFAIADKVVHCLVHPHEKVRIQAIKTMVRLADQRTPSILLGYFRKERFMNRALMLDALTHLATEEHADFLVSLLEDPNNIIKLKAGIVLANCCPDGMAILEQRAIDEPEPFARIVRHVKTVK
jgi:hypothetical protein